MRLWPGSTSAREPGQDPRAQFPIQDMPAEVRGEPTDDVLSAVCSALEKSKGELPQGRYPVRGQRGQEALIRRLLPILDGFDQIFRFGANPEAQVNESLQNWLKAIKGIHRHLLSALEKEGLRPISTLGERLDLNRHDVVDVRETLDSMHDTIVEEVERGYELNERILRDARVVVARRPS